MKYSEVEKRRQFVRDHFNGSNSKELAMITGTAIGSIYNDLKYLGLIKCTPREPKQTKIKRPPAVYSNRRPYDE